MYFGKNNVQSNKKNHVVAWFFYLIFNWANSLIQVFNLQNGKVLEDFIFTLLFTFT
jgi:hypothetical protein